LIAELRKEREATTGCAGANGLGRSWQPVPSKADVRSNFFTTLRYWQNGRHVRESTGTANERVARKIAAEKQAELDAGGSAVVDVGWDRAVKEFLAYKSAVCREATPDAYYWSLTAFEKLMKPKALKRIDVAVLRDFAAARCKTCLPPTTNKDIRAVRVFLYFAKSQHWLREVPKFREVWVREDERMPVNVPVAEYQEWLRKLDSGELKLTYHDARWYRTFAVLAYSLGCRRGELLGLTWRNGVDLDGGTVTVLSETSKGRSERMLPLTPDLVKMLQAWRAVNPDETHVLPHKGDVRRFYDDWHKITDRVPKNCRSSCGSQLVEGGIPTAVVQKWLGHSCITTTERFYVNPTNALRTAGAVRQLPK
jgi:integrase